MEKLHMIGWAFLLIVGIYVSAVTVVVDNEAEALIELAKGTGLEKVGCYMVGDPQKTATNVAGVNSKPVSVQYTLKFTIGGEPSRRSGGVEAASISDADIKAAMEPVCDAMWLEVQADTSLQEKTVIIPYKSNVKNEVYDVITKTWRSSLIAG